MTISFLEKLKAKKVAQEQGQPEPKPTSSEIAAASMASIRAKIKARAADFQAFQDIIGLSKQAVAPKQNPYGRYINLFDNNAPTDPTKVAARMVEAYNYGGAHYKVQQILGDCIEYNADEDYKAWELVEEVIGQMLEQANARAKLKPIITAKEAQAEEELAPEPYEAEEQAAGTGESFSLNITLNERQLAARDMAFAGKSFCYIGPAGSGKTTGQRAIAGSLYESGLLDVTSFKDIGGGYYDAPSIAFVAFTRRASGNLRKAIHKDPKLRDVFSGNIMTIHQLLEFAPEYYWDSISGSQKFRFAPRRHANNPLTITHLVVEEASMVGAHDLWQQLYDALPEGIQIIFIGDINQLPPVFGPSVLNYALVQLPIIELVETYRNQGAVLDNAHRILRGENIVETMLCNIIRGNKPVQVGQETMGNRVLPNLFKTLYNTLDADGVRMYDPDHDMIISPFNKQAMGTINMNKWIAQDLGDRRGAIVHEILAGFNKLYLAEGDRVMVNKRDGTITKIERNPQYMGREPQLPGKDLSRFGIRILDRASDFDLDDLDAPDMDYSNFSLEALEEQEAERKQQASHLVTVEYDDGFSTQLSGTGEFGDAVFSLGHVLTGHKAQGSEWRKVFILIHKDHSTMLFREWLYTVYTRARIGVTVIGKDYLIEKAIQNPRILGNTLADKLAYFNSGLNNTVDVQCTK